MINYIAPAIFDASYVMVWTSVVVFVSTLMFYLTKLSAYKWFLLEHRTEIEKVSPEKYSKQLNAISPFEVGYFINTLPSHLHRDPTIQEMKRYTQVLVALFLVFFVSTLMCLFLVLYSEAIL